MTTRRARLREATTRDIKAAARAHLRTHGAVALSLRAVARDAGISAPGLYRYFASRDDLLTALIVDAYDHLADTLLVASGRNAETVGVEGLAAPDPPTTAPVGAPVAARLRAVACAYRHWAVTFPNEFGLIFGTPVPGYAAPPGGPTVRAMTRVGDALGAPLVEAWQAGRFVPGPAFADPRLRSRLAVLDVVAGVRIPPEVAGALLAAWGRLHGSVCLEVFGHHRWVLPDGAEPLYLAEVEGLVRDWGMDP
jgi:AcrR family transcriptional regulator